MKIPIILELLLISTFIAFVASKSVEKVEVRDVPVDVIYAANSNVTDLKSSKQNTQQDVIVQDSVQIVQDLVDSQEIQAPNVGESDSINNEIIPGDKPTIATENNEVDNKPINENDLNPINKYCSCDTTSCECCRDFMIPLIPVRGPGCAKVNYLKNDRLSVQIKYGGVVLATRQIDSRRPAPICLPLPGGYNRFCGRVYGISRQDENFKACLGLELRADDDVEASLRVSCFQFGPKGLATMEADPLPSNAVDIDADGDDDEDDDDPLGLGELDDDEDDDDDDDDVFDDDDSGETAGPAGFIGDVLSGVIGGGGGGDDDDDFTGFSFLGGASDFVTDFFGGNSGQNKKKKPNETIKIDRKNDEKTEKKKKSEAVKKTSKNSNSKIVSETTEEDPDSLLDAFQETIEELSSDGDEEHATEINSSEDSDNLKEYEEYNDYEKLSEKDDDNEVELEDETHNNKTEHVTKKPTKTKKNKKASSYGFNFLGRFFSFLNGN